MLCDPSVSAKAWAGLGSGVCINFNSSEMKHHDLMLLRYMNVQSGNGFSVDKNLDDYNPTREAYAVGGASDSCECVCNDDLSFNKFKSIMDLKIEFMEKNERYFLNIDPIGAPDNYQQVIGAWVNWGGDAFIEVSDIVFDREEAIALGVERGEEAIWDFKNDCEIKLT